MDINASKPNDIGVEKSIQTGPGVELQPDSIYGSKQSATSRRASSFKAQQDIEVEHPRLFLQDKPTLHIAEYTSFGNGNKGATGIFTTGDEE